MEEEKKNVFEEELFRFFSYHIADKLDEQFMSIDELNGGKYSKARSEWNELSSEIQKKLGGNKEAYKIMCKLESFELEAQRLLIDHAYSQGIKDGVKLVNLLTNPSPKFTMGVMNYSESD